MGRREVLGGRRRPPDLQAFVGLGFGEKDGLKDWGCGLQLLGESNPVRCSSFAVFFLILA